MKDSGNGLSTVIDWGSSGLFSTKIDIKSTTKLNKDGKSFTVKDVDNIITFDIEASSGYRQPDGHVIGFDYNTAKLHPEFYNLATPAEQKKYGKVIYKMISYVWQAVVEDKGKPVVYMGRTPLDFYHWLSDLCDIVKIRAHNKNPINSQLIGFVLSQLGKHKGTYPKIHIFIHNLSYEFMWLRNLFNSDFSRKKGNRFVTFARTPETPFRAEITVSGVTVVLHDTYCLVNKSLKNWCKDSKLPVQKLEEPKEYYLPVRTPETDLTDEDLNYSINDVVSMYYGVRKYRDKYGSLSEIPMTQTGEVRRVLVEKVGKVDTDWAVACAEVTASYDYDQFSDLLQLFCGGFTHTNKIYTGRVFSAPVRCFDFRSSYPAVMVSSKHFPLTPFEDCDPSELKQIDSQPVNSREWVYYLEFEAYNVKCKKCNTIWSTSKCIELDNCVSDNGKIQTADKVRIIMTDLDWEMFNKFYSFDGLKILRCKKSKAGYLSSCLVSVILDYYKYKTSLKGDAEKESLYNESKQFINSVYGVMVTKIITDTIIFFGNKLTSKQICELIKSEIIKTNIPADKFVDSMLTPELVEDFNTRITNGWYKQATTQEDFANQIEKMLDKGDMYGTYQIGCWITAVARYRLLLAVYHLDNKAVYCDTDSIKGFFNDQDLEWFNNFNANIKSECLDAIAWHNSQGFNFTFDDYAPLTPKHTSKEIGYFDRESDCVCFRAWGAKRYADCEYDKDTDMFEIKTTIAGLPKSAGSRKLAKLYHEKTGRTVTLDKGRWLCDIPHHFDNDTIRLDTTTTPVSFFLDGISWDADESEKLVCHYVNDDSDCVWVDYNGDEYESTEYDTYGICLQPTSFSMTLSDDYEMLVNLLNDNVDMAFDDIPLALRKNCDRRLTSGAVCDIIIS